MGIEKIISNSGKGMRSVAIVGVLAATSVGCTTMDKRDEFARIPAENIGHYQSHEKFVFPRFSLDGRENKYFSPEGNPEDIKWMHENRLNIRPAAQCPNNYSLNKNKKVVFEDDSSCIVDICERSKPPCESIHSFGIRPRPTGYESRSLGLGND